MRYALQSRLLLAEAPTSLGSDVAADGEPFVSPAAASADLPLDGFSDTAQG